MWHVMRSGRKYGPFTPTQLKEMAQTGKLVPSDHVWKAGLSEWVPASKVRELWLSSLSQRADAEPSQSGDTANGGELTGSRSSAGDVFEFVSLAASRKRSKHFARKKPKIALQLLTLLGGFLAVAFLFGISLSTERSRKATEARPRVGSKAQETAPARSLTRKSSVRPEAASNEAAGPVRDHDPPMMPNIPAPVAQPLSDLSGLSPNGSNTATIQDVDAKDPSGFRDLKWGSPVLPGMQEVGAGLGAVIYKRAGDEMSIGGIDLHRLEYVYRDGRLVGVDLTCFGDREDLRQLTEAKFGPMERVSKFSLGNQVGWPFNAGNGLPLDGLNMRYRQGPMTTVCVLTWDSGGYLTKVILRSSDEARRRDEVRRQLLQGAAGGF